MHYDYLNILKSTLANAKSKNYAGYSKFDALNSPLINFLSFNNSWLRFAWTQFIKICPFNSRPLFGVQISRNPKGIALFARAYLSLYEKTGEGKFLDEAENLLTWLFNNRCIDEKEFCWGYNYTWQDIPPFVQYKGEPIIIVTIFAGESFIHAYRVTGDAKYLQAAESVCRFILNDLPVLSETKDEKAIAYVKKGSHLIVLNIQALSAALFAKVWQINNDQTLFDNAKKMLRYTIHKRTEYYAWFYTFPSGNSPIKHDNYHTGGILDAILEFIEATDDHEFSEVYWKGLEYYRANLFENNGAPRWMNDCKFPHDIHGAAQGIITFMKAGKHKIEFANFAEVIANWSIRYLYNEKEGKFIYRQDRFYKWNFSLMHWCNGWMTRAISELLK